jgi:hypothetical protein
VAVTLPAGEILLLLVSVGLLLGTAFLVSLRLARSPTELFWLLPACVSLQLGLLACGLSLVRLMKPPWWLAGQFALLVGAFLWSRRRPRPEPLDAGKPLRMWWTSAPLLARGATVIAVLFVVLSGFRQAVEPISGFDDRMYHASRVAYWMENASILPYPTHNERQVAFPFGSELYFLWPVLLTKSEVCGRVVFWLGFPLAAVGVHLLAGRAGAREPYRSFATLLFVSTPIVGSLSNGLAPELWLAFFEGGTAYWLLEAAGTDSENETARAAFWSGAFFLLALNVKTTAVGLAVPLAFLPFTFVRRGAAWPSFRALVGGALAGLLLSGLALNCAGNLLRCGNPFGSAGLRTVHRSDLDARQLVIHATRLPFALFELPWVPGSLRERLEMLGEAAATRLGATRTISFEDSPWFWPGKFHFNLPPAAKNYSLGGVLWLPALLGAGLLAVRRFRTAGRGNWRSGLLVCTAVAWFSLLPVVFGLRWMVESGVPIRFLIAPWALGAILLGVLASRRPMESRLLTAAAALLVAAQALPSLHGGWRAALAALQNPPSEAALDEPFAKVLPKVPPGSRILLFADQGTRDYPLFRPREGFPNRVATWGQGTPTPDAVLDLVRRYGITRVVFVTSEWLSRHWDPPIRVAETVAALSRDPRFREFPVSSSAMRVFEIRPLPDGSGASP